MKLVNVGYGNMAAAHRLIAVYLRKQRLFGGWCRTHGMRGM